MASLLDFLSGSGLLGNFGSGSFYSEPDEAQAAREAAAAAFRSRSGLNRPRPGDAPVGPMGGQAPIGLDPFNFMMPGYSAGPPPPQPMAGGGQQVRQDPFSSVMPGYTPQQPPMQTMPVSLQTEPQQPPQPPPQPPQPPPQMQPRPTPQVPGLGDRLYAGFQGLANSDSPLGGLGNLVGGLVTGQRTDSAGVQQQSLLATYNALKDIMPEPVARAATLNPEILKTVAPEYFSGWQLVKVGSNPITGDVYMMKGPGGRLQPLEKFIQGGGAPGAAVGTIDSGLLAKGVTKYDPYLPGDEYLKQFGPEMQAAVKAYMAGHVLPTGNPRQASIASTAKTVAQTYGMKIGQTVTDDMYSQMRKYRTELGSTSPTTAGGQAKAFDQGIQHAYDLANKLEGLQNWNGLGIPFLASGANTIREAFSNNQSGLASEARALGQTLAGEVGKLFSGNAGGGVHERELTRDRFKTISSGPELAGALRGTIETMEGGLHALEARRDQILGPNSDVQFLSDQTRQKIEKIREIADRLEKGAAGPKSSPGPATPGQWQTLPNGVKIRQM